MNAGTSRIYIATGQVGQGLSDEFRKACQVVAADPETPKYAAIDIIMWLALTGPNDSALKPGTMIVRILDGDDVQFGNCWKCLATLGMSELVHGYAQEGLEELREAAKVAKRDIGSVPIWLNSKIGLATSEIGKKRGVR
jgi:hypothetical protein